MKRAILQEILRKCHDQLQRGSHPQKDNFIHWTFLVRDNHIISSGVNRPVEPAQHFGYHRAFNRAFSKEAPLTNPTTTGVITPLVPKLHSELDCFRRCKENPRGCEAVNVRLNKTGEMRMSLPCVTCAKLFYAVKIKKVFFTTKLGWANLCIS